VTFLSQLEKVLLVDVPTALTTALFFGNGPLLSTTLSFCHPDRSEAEGRDLRCAIRMPHPYRSTTSTNHRILAEPRPSLRLHAASAFHAIHL
jgi:hypothetical protein